MALGDVLYESGSRQDYVYFPTSSIVFLLYVMEDGSYRDEEEAAAKAAKRGLRKNAKPVRP